MTQERPGHGVPKAQPAFGFHACPADGATVEVIARLRQHNLTIEQRDHVPGGDGADDEGGAGPWD